jgi:dolichol-phosphate mannosyltransferase
VPDRNDSGQTRLSAVIACYNDAQAIPHMHKRLCDVFSSLAVDYEIIFVNDGSPDETDAVLKELAVRDGRVLAIEHARNFGSQNAFLSGLQAATGDAVILLDGDLQDPPEVIPAFYEQWRAGYDVVYGRRAKRDTSLLRGLCYKAFYRIFRRVSSVPMPLDAGDFSLLDRKVVNALLDLPETDPFLRGLRAWVGFKQTGVDYDRPRRPFGRSTNTWLSNIGWAKKGIFSFGSAPVAWLGYLAAVLTALALAGLVGTIVDCVRRPAVSHGVAIVVVFIALFGSLNMLAIALVGEYVVKILEEAKRRPRFVRKAIRQGEQHCVTAAEMEALLSRRRGEGKH